MFEIPRIWAGSQESFDFMLTAMTAAAEMVEARGTSKDPFELPPLVSIQEGVGIVSMKGPLVSGSAGFMRLFGVTGYADIQEAMIQAASSKDVKAILLDTATGGGAVEGADEASQLVRQVAGMKPVLTYASGNMASAGMWVGSAGTRRLASRTSLVGSIGVMVTFLDRSKQLEQAGITPTVVRSGKWKALANGVEPLNADGKAHLQAVVDDLNVIFEERLAANLNTSVKTVHDKMGQGREFLGARAVDVGLIDGIASFQEAFATAKILAKS